MTYSPFLKNNNHAWSDIFRISLLLLFLWLSAFSLSARHIIGGDVKYTCLGLNTAGDSVHFEVVFTMYRDSRSGGANFDNGVQFGIYKQIGNNSWDYVRRVTSFVEGIKDIPANNNNPCIIVPPNIGVEKGVYTFDVWLPIITQDYMIAFQRCCRNPTISNLFFPDETGAAFTITISPLAQQSCNSSPEFNGFPPVVLCANEPVSFDHSASDAENDQIVYEFCTPLASGGQQNTNNCQGVIPNPANCLPPFKTVNFLLPGFSFSKPMGGNPIVSIHAATGVISGTPQITGQFVVGVCIKEYRNGVLLTSTQRDFQFNVQQCGRVVTPKIQTDFIDKDTFVFTSCQPTTIAFNNVSLGGNFINSYDWEMLIGDSLSTYQTKNIQVYFPERKTYYGKLLLNKEVGCKDSAFVKIQIFPEIQSGFQFQYDTCLAGPVQFINESLADAGGIIRYDWRIDSLPASIEKNPSVLLEKTGQHSVFLEVSDKNNCKDTLERIINWQPVPSLVILEPDTREACVPATITFRNLSKPIDDTYRITWIFSQGDTSNSFQPAVYFDQPGIYDVELEIISPIGCITKKNFQEAVTIYEKPVAGFRIEPEKLNVFSENFQAIDASKNANASRWYLNDEAISFEIEPVISIRDTGIQILEQIVFNKWGCSDTMNSYFDVEPIATVFMPDAFTPNQDGLNDNFLPVGNFFGIKSYQYTVFNRWGAKIYESENPMSGWDGLHHGVESPTGTYLYNVQYVEPRGKKVVYKGSFQLIR